MRTFPVYLVGAQLCHYRGLPWHLANAQQGLCKTQPVLQDHQGLMDVVLTRRRCLHEVGSVLEHQRSGSAERYTLRHCG